MTRVLAALLLAQFAPTLATHGRRRLHLISAADVSSITSSATTTTSPSSAFDLLPSTHWRSDAAAPYLSATLASSAWSLTSYGLSTYGLHGADAAVAPTAWSLSCVNASGAADVVDARSGETLATDELRSGSVVGARANMTALRSFFARGEHPSPPMEVRAGKLAENVTMQRL